MGNLGIYQDAQGHRFRMTAEDANARGYLPVSRPEPVIPPEAPEPAIATPPAKAVSKAKNKARSST